MPDDALTSPCSASSPPAESRLSRRQLLTVFGSTLAASALTPALGRVARSQDVPMKPRDAPNSVALCDLDLSLMDQDWNVAQRNQSVIKNRSSSRVAPSRMVWAPTPTA